MSQQTHYFYAIKLPEEVKLIMKNLCEQLKETLPFGRWVHHEDLHITLAFLGNAPAGQLEASLNNVGEALKETEGFKLEIDKLGIFGRNESPRIFWADTKGSKELQIVRKQVFSACEEAGFQLETRPFRPHITLARKWTGEGAFYHDLLHIWNQIQPDPIPFMANEVVLYQTHLQKNPKYEAKKVFSLI